MWRSVLLLLISVPAISVALSRHQAQACVQQREEDGEDGRDCQKNLPAGQWVIMSALLAGHIWVGLKMHRDLNNEREGAEQVQDTFEAALAEWNSARAAKPDD